MPEWLLELVPARPRDMYRRYGLELSDYVALLYKQEGSCAICANRFTSKNLPAIDHCHDQLHVRGLLCKKCNFGIGLLGDSVELVQKALTYLKTDREKTMPKKVTQLDQVLDYLSRRGHINQATANSVYGISRLASVIHRLKAKDYDITTTMVQGIRAPYAVYSLATK